MRFSLKEFIEQAQESTTNPKAVAVLVKEFLHFDILNALSQSPLGTELVFQGGTALRTCHGGERLSEDLDFVCGPSHGEFDIEKLIALLRESVSERYGVHLEGIKSPERDLSDPERKDVKWWEFHLKFADMGRVEKIRLEVCNVPSYDSNFELIRARHGVLANSLPPFMLRVESMEEILADKLKALGSRKFVKNRDIWDLKFLHDNRVRPDYLMVAQKVKDYRNSDSDYLDQVGRTIDMLLAPDAQAKFCEEMTRFVDLPLAQQLEAHPGVAESWIRHAVRELRKLQDFYPEAAAARDAGAFEERLAVNTYDPAPSF